MYLYHLYTMGGEHFLGQVPNFSNQGFEKCPKEIIVK